MTASGIVTVTVRVTVPRVEITNVEFSAIPPTSITEVRCNDKKSYVVHHG